MAHAGTALRTLRVAQKLSLREVARRANVQHGYLSKVERGQRQPSERWLKSVTDVLADDAIERSA